MLIVGAGARGNPLAQRLARRGLEDHSCWRPGRSGTQTTDWVSEMRPALSTSSIGPSPRVIGGEDPVELGKNNCGRGVGGSMIHYAGFHPALSPLRLRGRKPRRRGSRLADLLPGTRSTLRASGARAAHRRGVGGPGGIRTAIRTARTRSAPVRCAPGKARAAFGIQMRVGPVGDRQRQLRGTVRTASTAATACRAAR